MQYLRYALGEIVLVVVGILIALQINNWNEARKLKIDEISALYSLRDGLKKDIESFDVSLWYCTRAENSMEYLLSWMEKGLPYQDSLKYHFGNTNSLITANINTSIFESLKSRDLNMISNNRLRQQIVNFFDSEHNSLINQTNRYRVLLEEASQRIYDSRFDEFWGTGTNGTEIRHYVNINGRDLEVLDPVMVPVDFEALKKDREYRYFLKSLKNRHHYYMLEVISNTKAAMKAMIRNIDAALLQLESQ